ncbi:bifunctional tRNA (5-methylaminomethyl-2-thiouridine)(34)-methyltransferase MnmD/FAD-dependent 5-carboxymethylaminomethyl-2-thiouridine(34) oxidoreductase MnmC [Spongiibacter sp. KMU-166]|uniref:tRNA 5-methylaminomethyl-2-thiouridine biosynthesis bifunctional protein MnmC n=1 Tax=Spongiibacter thalassae TaxID=2721624 RepID=A0ABX1GFE5_9GAMM|nr:bifunctional tRNA (5-methylaminomethyl-2-thiouridine)(34)-methyltransferase MnmD/FAD-dependent 5-carboxymethylaminomethyl-2-thiouridine(34) oxidoreductase MnmC [Spongiibacter thalassae]NKI17163.1 bifunctional tRNA (5-methylaminomethyl-2-thiouridine)(34)-methyltransferase MnmD/FAD-dependent 5-carboxymethylaminomethyl-2-thiouridine(34) oxidoreductase MnmC [Spongiibacter thalassae]
MEHRDNPYFIQSATLSWEDGIPCAEAYGDVYFSRDDGLAESQYVFLQHNQLAQRWQNLDPQCPGRFTICESGFGTGLNFLLAWQLWQQCAPANWTLHYISSEKHPLTPQDLQISHGHWPALATLSNLLQELYPPLLPGHHRRNLHDHRVCLDLLFGDIVENLPALLDTEYPALQPSNSDDPPGATTNRVVDAWFLDGFAPASNPEMWQQALFAAMQYLSRDGATFATFTSAGVVKRGLRAAGFSVRKVKGFGRKREMLCGEFVGADDGSPAPPLPPRKGAVAWHQPQSRGSVRSVIVIGGGLAGCSTAWALAERGIQVQLLERGPTLATGASGNPQGILYTKLSPEAGALNQFTLHSFLYALHHYRQLAHRRDFIHDFCGVLQLPGSEREAELYRRVAEVMADQHWVKSLDAASASALAGLAIDRPGLFYPGAGWISPTSLCAAYTQHPDITVHHCKAALSLRATSQGWKIDCGDTQFQSDAVVIANSHDAAKFPYSDYLPLRKIRGQLSYLPADAVLKPPATVICHDGYIAPPIADHYCIGASFNLNDDSTALSDAEHHDNLRKLRALDSAVIADDTEVIGGRAALRCASPDYMPIVGALPDTAAFDRDFASLRKDARLTVGRPGRYHANLYINVAHGSRGLTSTPMAAELLASYLCGEARPLPRHLSEALSPARFIIRDLSRHRR